ncbi:hypothetical protein [Chenggangzhangella methanolivorans]|uniref:Uncharacterized protein n=1 Tax=Chenggangzhangella methanolivorans TaxID=1437009 RepID=A0A9E6R7H0_9HYPH|nr:hypothetical protein [Chenggangzhangella methanolivorans]QZN98841.1 hypothetical protein K6K41_18125 [Chenggangzhangella methanolivorans]
MAITPLERFAGPSIYPSVDELRSSRSAAAPRAVDDAATDPRPVGPVEPRTVSEPPAIESLTSSARAATVALAATPREAISNLAGAQAAAAEAEDAALAALADPLDPPTPQEIAQNFAAVAALVPSPERLANAAAVPEPDDGTVAASGSVANDRGFAEQAFLAGTDVGTRLSRYA